MCKSIKLALYSCLIDKGRLHDSLEIDELRTFLCRIKANINRRPITYVDSEISEIRPIAPAHFINGTTDIVPPDLLNINKIMRQKWSFREELTCMFKI